MRDKIDALRRRIEEFTSSAAGEVEDFRIAVLGKKGELTALMEKFRTVPADQKRELGQAINHVKELALERINALKESLGAGVSQQAVGDLTRPGTADEPGSRHPVAIVRDQMCEIFIRMGFSIADGPEIEDDWHVFGALNFPPDHPARDMQDTFFIAPDVLLRTHTSSIQVRVMESQKPPIRVVCPGRVFRNEAISARSHCMFHQVEGLYIDEGVSFADMRQAIDYFAKEFFGAQTEIRMRPSYFPFTEPSAEVDVSCQLCGGKGCAVCKGTGWLEIMGCGMVDPNVLEACGIDPQRYSGFAFGMGVERTAMLKYGIRDIRLLFENDVRFLRQLEAAG
jgi:phenylalanyl-tRNA synthetase alpha chain